MPIYTRTGDKGKTSLFDGTRVPKYHVRVGAYGTIDELNSVIGVAIAQLGTKNKELRTELEGIQHDLFEIGSALAMPHPLPVEGVDGRVGEFEKLIDKMTGKLPDLKNFILPGGGLTGAHLHIARTVARRAERAVIKMSGKEKIDKNIVIYLNRLSDLLFTMARYANSLEKKKEKIWVKR